MSLLRKKMAEEYLEFFTFSKHFWNFDDVYINEFFTFDKKRNIIIINIHLAVCD